MLVNDLYIWSWLFLGTDDVSGWDNSCTVLMREKGKTPVFRDSVDQIWMLLSDIFKFFCKDSPLYLYSTNQNILPFPNWYLKYAFKQVFYDKVICSIALIQHCSFPPLLLSCLSDCWNLKCKIHRAEILTCLLLVVHWLLQAHYALMVVTIIFNNKQSRE